MLHPPGGISAWLGESGDDEGMKKVAEDGDEVENGGEGEVEREKGNNKFSVRPAGPLVAVAVYGTRKDGTAVAQSAWRAAADATYVQAHEVPYVGPWLSASIASFMPAAAPSEQVLAWFPDVPDEVGVSPTAAPRAVRLPVPDRLGTTCLHAAGTAALAVAFSAPNTIHEGQGVVQIGQDAAPEARVGGVWIAPSAEAARATLGPQADAEVLFVPSEGQMREFLSRAT
jgi:hypothetical protein